MRAHRHSTHTRPMRVSLENCRAPTHTAGPSQLGQIVCCAAQREDVHALLELSGFREIATRRVPKFRAVISAVLLLPSMADDFTRTSRTIRSEIKSWRHDDCQDKPRASSASTWTRWLADPSFPLPSRSVQRKNVHYVFDSCR